jgi:hypothetical protein
MSCFLLCSSPPSSFFSSTSASLHFSPSPYLSYDVPWKCHCILLLHCIMRYHTTHNCIIHLTHPHHTASLLFSIHLCLSSVLYPFVPLFSSQSICASLLFSIHLCLSSLLYPFAPLFSSLSICASLLFSIHLHLSSLLNPFVSLFSSLSICTSLLRSDPSLYPLQVIKFDNEGLTSKDIGRDIRLEVGTLTTPVASFFVALYVPLDLLSTDFNTR